MNLRDILTIIGGLLGVIGPILQGSSHEGTKLAGQICLACGMFLVGTRGLKIGSNTVDAIDVQPALERDINSRVEGSWAPAVVIPRERRYPEQPWTPLPEKSREERWAEQDAWLASNKTKP